MWVRKIEKSYEGDEEVARHIEQLAIDKETAPGYSFSQGILRKQKVIVLRKGQKIRRTIFELLHEGPLGGHYGIQGTDRRM